MMKRNHVCAFVNILVILLAVIACVLPGQTIQPTPPINPITIESAVAGTAQAAAQQTAVVQPVVTSLTGTAIEQLEGGGTKYSDFDGGFEITFPVGWLTVRANSEEFNAALSKEGKVNTVLHKQMTDDVAGYDPKVDRLYSYILRPDINKKNVMLGSSELECYSQDKTSLDSTTVGQVVRELESASGLSGFHADTARVREDSVIKMIEIGGQFTVKNEKGEAIPFHTTFIFFKPTSDSTVRMSFTYFQSLYAEISPDVKSLVESIRIIGSQQ